MGFPSYNYSAGLRVRAIQSQLRAAFTVCSSARTALGLREVTLAREALKNVKRAADWVRAHLAEPNHVPPEAIAGIAEQLVKLDQELANLETQVWR
jgi:phage shock protein A